jgi:hypothetical protein
MLGHIEPPPANQVRPKIGSTKSDPIGSDMHNLQHEQQRLMILSLLCCLGQHDL